MKLNENAVAKTSGVLGAWFFLVCYLLVFFMPEVYKAIVQSWMHGVDLNLIWKPMTGNFLLGFASFSAVSWVSGWLFAWIYNKFSK
ncbi:hypothetical protein A2210_03400 [Candidatus Woesebacteria bacterium RIFOXYA1_FULL_40_18]|uniref:Uncharacterized protein n=4 Tax=Candidatus Woeseibacteriota TaxID=1752722 RepID=A0A0G0SM16_9BACT|nr:MAG: hypothetical protein UU03_C0004G0002 [Candidatus Woesebacteria bacterium GW2011_GWA1_40_45]OGM77211.1 MAG: hypothetical protein A2210_03400 [Candidatus Woesebacteria bacterium RIFOXYA1_FULL_40_18]OGM79877.1 MAG: hypothetical protein A2361_02185 [Candidatus Woesebacteria bacterium RIFOXYB1_FULL_40_26]OGM87129.1 MAG: hypothetical protein A2614_02285 [Candidatus Woesebacteria bacterium RIFOXYD1_FULL_40_21]